MHIYGFDHLVRDEHSRGMDVLLGGAALRKAGPEGTAVNQILHPQIHRWKDRYTEEHVGNM